MKLDIAKSAALIAFFHSARATADTDAGRSIFINDCDILIAGGSLSAVSAAITAANTSSSQKICLLEPTDWAGGQLTSSSVPPDIPGALKEVNMASSFIKLMNEVTGGTWSSNPGKCWVSLTCFESMSAAAVLGKWLESFSPNLRVYFNTVVSASSLNVCESGERNINKVTAIRRQSMPNHEPWSQRLSQELPDWYSPHSSDFFSKEVLEFTDFKVIVEATEFGDVLMTSGVQVAQGIETPLELSETYQSSCGQATVFPFHIGYSSQPFDSSSVPQGSLGGQPASISKHGLTWAQAWTYRRTVAVGVGSYDDSLSNATVSVTEQSNQNLENDYTSGYLYLPLGSDLTGNQSNWMGGINMTTLRGAEERAYAYYHYVRGECNDSLCDDKRPPVDVQPFLAFNSTQVGTKHGLVKVPYLRDSRRSKFGINGFRLTYDDLSVPYQQEGGVTARPFPDTVGLGYYPYADVHHLAEEVCQPEGYPAYLGGESNKPVLPYQIPFRALTSMDADNLLVSGKSMAQTFLANAGTRLHPSEWASGVAAGAAAVLMSSKGWTTTNMSDNINVLQESLSSDRVDSPLRWTF